MKFTGKPVIIGGRLALKEINPLGEKAPEGAKWMRDRLAPMISKLEEYKQKYGEL